MPTHMPTTRLTHAPTTPGRAGHNPQQHNRRRGNGPRSEHGGLIGVRPVRVHFADRRNGRPLPLATRHRPQTSPDRFGFLESQERSTPPRRHAGGHARLRGAMTRPHLDSPSRRLAKRAGLPVAVRPMLRRSNDRSRGSRDRSCEGVSIVGPSGRSVLFSKDTKVLAVQHNKKRTTKLRSGNGTPDTGFSAFVGKDRFEEKDGCVKLTVRVEDVELFLSSQVAVCVMNNP